MQKFVSTEEFSNIENNTIIGAPAEMVDSKIEFHGENNILFFDEGVVLYQSSIRFLGNNNVVFISNSGKHKTKLKVDTYNNSSFYIGKACNTTRPIHVVLSEGKNVIIGNECLFSLDIWFRNADPHLIYDGTSKARINPSKSVYLGDHVWIGQEALITKGTKIGSGSIIGAKAVTGGKTIESNCSAGGVPCKVLKQNIFWLKDSVHNYTNEKTEKSMYYKKDAYLYSSNGSQTDFSEIENALDKSKTSQEKLDCLKKYLFENEEKNRFFIPPITNKKKSLFRK